jgi:HD superfamily phosphohydrolase YqeK
MARPEGIRIQNKQLLPSWTVEIMKEMGRLHKKRYEHSIRVGFIAYTLWRGMMEENHDDRFKPQQNNLLIAGLVHDCGKTGVIDNESLFTWHAHIGAALIYMFDRDVADIIRGHHRWGKGLSKTDRPEYFIDAFARAEASRRDYEVIKKAQIVLAVADKADSIINRGDDGIGGRKVQNEIETFLRCFGEELANDDVSTEMLKRALKLARITGRHQLRRLL